MAEHEPAAADVDEEQALPGVVAVGRAVEVARANGSWEILDSVDRLEVPEDLASALDAIPAAVADLARAGALVITLGAGSIGSVPAALMRELERRHATEAPS